MHCNLKWNVVAVGTRGVEIQLQTFMAVHHGKSFPWWIPKKPVRWNRQFSEEKRCCSLREDSSVVRELGSSAGGREFEFCSNHRFLTYFGFIRHWDIINSALIKFSGCRLMKITRTCTVSASNATQATYLLNGQSNDYLKELGIGIETKIGKDKITRLKLQWKRWPIWLSFGLDH